jgi:putative nucleotidyltransferase with HDIG domain
MTSSELFNKINDHLIQDDSPAKYLNEISKLPIFMQYPFSMLYKEKLTEQSKRYHPEGNVWNHTLLVVNQAALLRQKSKNPSAFMWAALLHDIGKPQTTKMRKGKITSYNHEIVGSKLAEQFLSVFYCRYDFIAYVSSLIRWHMQILFFMKNPSFTNVSQMLKEVDIHEIALLGYCDRTGRRGADEKVEKQNIQLFINKINNNLKL